MANQCTATTKAGERCRQASTVDETGLCLLHDPARKRQVLSIRRRGQKAATKKRRENSIRTVAAGVGPEDAETEAEIATYLSWITGAVKRGDLDPRTGDTMVRSCNAQLRARKESKTVEDVAELRAQVAELLRGSMGIR